MVRRLPGGGRPDLRPVQRDGRSGRPRPYAQQHLELIVRFGRFPHRNAVLGQVSTPEEETYLDRGGETFGQG